MVQLSAMVSSTSKMNMFILRIALLFVTGNYLVDAQCTWNLNTDLPAKNPLYLSSTGTNMVIPTANGLYLPTNGVMTLACTGSSNTLVGTDAGKQEINVTCNGQNMLSYNSALYNLNSFYCVSTVSTDIAISTQACGSGTIMNLGYTVSRGFSSLITTCYDRTKETVLYSTNTLYGIALPAAQIDNNRPSFRSTGLTYGTTAANCYKQTEQTIRFTTLLGSTLANTMINSTSYLARGHISPDGDFLFATWASTSYYLVNAAPQWQNINAGNWLKIENTARDIAVAYQENMLSMTGVYGVLQLPNQSGTLVDMYLLSNQLFKVPKWYWKVIYSEQTHKGIAFVSSNNPFLTSITSSDLLCPNICSSTSWNITGFEQFTKGYSYCCDVNALLTAISSPVSLTVTGNITGI